MNFCEIVDALWAKHSCGLDLRLSDSRGSIVSIRRFSVYIMAYTPSVNGGIYRKLREARGCPLGTLFPSGDFGWCIYQHIHSIVNADIYMNFREAVDALCTSLSLD